MRHIHEWQAAWIERRAPGFGPDAWVRDGQVSLRPGEDCGPVARSIALEECLPFDHVRLIPIDF